MTDDPMELLTKIVPELFNGAMEDMKAAADGGDGKAKAKLEDAAGSQMAIRIVLEGDDGGEVYLVGDGGSLKAQEEKPDIPVLLCVATPHEALQIALEEMGHLLEKGLAKARKGIAMGPKSSKGIAMLEGMSMKFHSVMKDTPDFDEVRTKITLGSGDVAEDPKFTITMEYEVFEQLRERKLKPQAMMSKLQIEGDAAQFMQMGMDFMAKMPK